MDQLFWDNKNDVFLVQKILKKGGGVISSTDTVLGLLADISEGGYMKLNNIKRRTKKPYLILAENYAKIIKYIHIETLQIENFVRKIWPGAVTLIFRAKSDVPIFAKSEQDTIAIRVPKHAGLQQLLSQFDGLFSTSANITGEPIPHSITEVSPAVLKAVEAIILDRYETKEKISSTILDCTGKKIVVVRDGAYPIDQLEKIYGEKFIR